MTKWRIWSGSILSLCLLATSLPSAELVMAEDAAYDVVILDGRVMDPETGFDGIRNVGILDGRIAIITKEEIKGQRALNARGHVVAPGFIDTHFHSLTPFGVKLALRDGVTSALDLELGALEIAAWYAEKKGKWQINYGTTVSQELIRQFVLDGVRGKDATTLSDVRGEIDKRPHGKWTNHINTPEEWEKITALYHKGLKEGALGIGSTVGYMPAGISAREMYETQKIAAGYGRLTAVHTRHLGARPPEEFVTGAQEVIANAVALRAPLLLVHINNVGYDLINELAVLARRQGYTIWTEIYPYLAGSGTIGSVPLRPETWEDKMGLKYEETMLDPVTGKFLTRDEYLRLARTDPGKRVVVFSRREEWIPDWLKLEGTTIGCDCAPAYGADGRFLSFDAPYEAGVFHPRTAGSHAAVLRLGHQYKIPLMQSLRQLSYWSAKFLGEAGIEAMKRRGRMQQGMDADIVIFDPENVRDNATYELGKNGLPSTGIPYVLVNGSIVVDESIVVAAVKSGQAIRFTSQD